MAPRGMNASIHHDDDDDDNNKSLHEKTPLINEDSNNTGKSDDDNGFSSTTAALAFCMLAQSYLLVGVFPYSGFMVMHLVPGQTEETAGRYAGWIASAFMLGRTVSSYQWGQASDRYGRTFVIKASLGLSAVFSILFGMAPTYTWALIFRALLGLSNGLIGSIKTLISELSSDNSKKETKMMALVMGVWGYGFLINPAISGFTSDPVKQYPDSPFVLLFYSTFEAYPFLLPNLVGCLFCIIGYHLVEHCVEETLPVKKIETFSIKKSIEMCFQSNTKKNQNPETTETSADLEASPKTIKSTSITGISPTSNKWIRPSPSTSALLFDSNEEEENDTSEKTIQKKDESEDEEGEATISSLWNRPSTRQHLMFYWFLSFLVICIDEIFPLFCISKYSGLGIQEKWIGKLLSGSGFFYVFIQYFLLTKLVESFGFYPALRIGTALSIPLACLVPVSLIWDSGDGSLNWTTWAYLSCTYAWIRASCSVTFSVVTMITNRTVPAHHRASMNGLSMLGGSLAKGIGPAFAGILFSYSVENVTPPYGSVVVYSIISLLGAGLFVQSMLLKEHQST